MSLGLRRPVQIGRDNFRAGADSDNVSSMLHHLVHEMRREVIHQPGPQQLMGGLFLALCELCLVLTDSLLLVHPHETAQGLMIPDYQERLKACHGQLNAWYTNSFNPLVRKAGYKSPEAIANLKLSVRSVLIYFQYVWLPIHAFIQSLTTSIAQLKLLSPNFKSRNSSYPAKREADRLICLVRCGGSKTQLESLQRAAPSFTD